jgi:ZIP family zinc transporter
MKPSSERSHPAQTPKKIAGWAILGWLVLGCMSVVLLNSVYAHLSHGSTQMRGALIGGGIAAAATSLGTLPVLLSQAFSKRTFDCFLGFGAGVMLGATAFSLIVPALAAAREQGAGATGASLIVGGGILLGAGFIILLDRFVRVDTRAMETREVTAGKLKRAWMFVSAVTLHNLPEGLAIGVAYSGPHVEKAHSLATGIAIQNVPEGLVVALTLLSVGYGRVLSALLGVLSGLVEPVAAVFGVAVMGISAGLLPVGLACAAGAMLYVIVHDVVPEAHANKNGTFASVALVGGFILMTVLDTALA